MDRRSEKTKEAIEQSFYQLLSEKKYREITIQDILDRANVGRSTFYSHFHTKDELVTTICLKLFERAHANGTLESSTAIAGLLHHIRENRKIIRGIFFSSSGELFENVFKKYFNTKIESAFLSSYTEKETGIPKDFLLNHISGSFIELVKWWDKNNMKQTPEELTKYFLSVISPITDQSHQ
jgi:AcrR family transcriptional regulator